MPLLYTDKSKYLGHIQNTNNNITDQIMEKKITETAYKAILAIAGKRNFKGTELQAIWEMVECCVCNATEADMKYSRTFKSI